MARNTSVKQTYTPSQNVSITTVDGTITLVTLWATGDSADKTVREGQTSEQRNTFPRK